MAGIGWYSVDQALFVIKNEARPVRAHTGEQEIADI
jgi:hypothetical protein